MHLSPFVSLHIWTNVIYFQGHNKEVLSICWDPSGKYIASISEDTARVWSVSGRECLHELRSTGNKFQSCTFHPGYSQLLVIGGYQVKYSEYYYQMLFLFSKNAVYFSCVCNYIAVSLQAIFWHKCLSFIDVSTYKQQCKWTSCGGNGVKKKK